MFFSENGFHFFRLPVKFTEMVVVTNRFHVKPLLPIITTDGAFHILAVSQNRLRLLEGTRYTVDEIELGDTPETLADTFPDGFPEKKLQAHSGRQAGSGDRAGLVFGNDPGSEMKSHIQQWFHTVEKAVTDILTDTQAPLVLAGVESLFPLYKEVNTYPHLLDEGIREILMK